MSKWKISAFVIVLGFGVQTLGCSGGSSSNRNIIDPDRESPPVGDFLAIGPVSPGGSFIIGGVSIDTDQAQVFVNNRPSSMAVLRPGHIARVLATTDANRRTSASEIHFNANIIGPVDSVNTGSQRLTVMGQTVLLDSNTRMDTALADFSRGEVVQVSGYPNANGEIIASRIDYSVSNQELRLLGTVVNHDAANFGFSVNGLTVDYSSALTIDVPSGQLTDGLEVEITGGLAFNGTFRVDTVTYVDRDLTEFAGAHIRADGQITDIINSSNFSVNGFPVEMGSQRDFRNGAPNDIAIGASVSVEGNVQADGTVLVHRVWFIRD